MYKSIIKRNWSPKYWLIVKLTSPRYCTQVYWVISIEFRLSVQFIFFNGRVNFRETITQTTQIIQITPNRTLFHIFIVLIVFKFRVHALIIRLRPKFRTFRELTSKNYN